MQGKCPKCGEVIARLVFEKVPLADVAGKLANFKAVTYSCPACFVVLGAVIDPEAVIGDAISHLV